MNDDDGMPAPAARDDLVGRVLSSRFRLVRRLGAGGMGAVYEAEDLEATGRVALKVIKAHLVEDPSVIKRFQREARTIGSMKSAHIVGFIDAGEDQGVHWLAMELLDGLSLRERVSSRGPMPWRESLAVVREIVLGLGAAHAVGIVHRDLKPDNVMLVVDPTGTRHVKLLDFGIAKVANAETQTMTGTGMLIGTPGFVAPEVVVGGPSDDPRADFYSLGATWFEMLTARKPFSATTPFALAMKHVNEPPPRATDLMPYAPVPAPVEELLARLLAKRPEQRPPDAAALLAMVEAIERGADLPLESATSQMQTITSMSGPLAAADPPTQAMDAAATRPTSVHAVVVAKPRPSAPLVAAAAFVALSLIVSGVLWLTRPRTVVGNSNAALNAPDDEARGRLDGEVGGRGEASTPPAQLSTQPGAAATPDPSSARSADHTAQVDAGTHNDVVEGLPTPMAPATPAGPRPRPRDGARVPAHKPQLMVGPDTTSGSAP